MVSRKNKPSTLELPCSSCGDSKPVAEFQLILSGPRSGHYHSWCKTCLNSDKRKRQARNNHLKRTYGISLEEYERLLEEQKGRCAICGKHYTEEKKALHVDHNHINGLVRGLLCNRCNSFVVGRYLDQDHIAEGLRRYICENPAQKIWPGRTAPEPKARKPRRRKRKLPHPKNN